METSEAVQCLSALAHDGRLAIFRLLVGVGPEGMAAGRIASSLGILSNTLSSHLNLLSNAGLVSSRRDGRSIIYSIDVARMNGLLAFLVSDCCQGRPELCLPAVTRAACCTP